MRIKFFVVVNGNATPDSWSAWIWRDLKGYADIYLDNNSLKWGLLRKLKKLHFGNKSNRLVWLPFKYIWDNNYSIKLDSLNINEKNCIIFQSGVKFSPSYIERLKRERNAYIVLYLPDTIRNLGIASNKTEFERYCSYYKIDSVYSFDFEDCKEFGLKFFDIYSALKGMNTDRVMARGIFYIGNCRSNERYSLLMKVLKKIEKAIDCRLYLVGVTEERYHRRQIVYNSPMKYGEVIQNVIESDCILELMNEGQNGNTLRFKEAVCYNRRLLTNNRNVLGSKYFNPKWIQVFSDPDAIDIEWLRKKEKVNFAYEGDYSPLKLIKYIIKEIKERTWE